MIEFIVEDGTGVEDSTSYVTLEQSNTYLGECWSASDQLKQRALIKASEYIDLKFVINAPTLSLKQGLNLPKVAVIDAQGRAITGVHNNWIKSVCLYAKAYNESTLYPSQTVSDASTKDIIEEEVTVGPITTKTKYSDKANVNLDNSPKFTSFTIADALAQSVVTLISSNTKNNRVIR